VDLDEAVPQGEHRSLWRMGMHGGDGWMCAREEREEDGECVTMATIG
jgi:hypothetical protein